jgi:phosphatidylglycerophosphate synthase
MPYRRLKIIKGWIDKALKPLMEKIAGYGVKPNHISMLSLPVGLLGVLLLYDSPFLAAILIFSYLALDVLDGTLARCTDQVSKGGAKLDFLFDRILASAFLAQLYLVSGETLLPLTGFFFIIAFTLEDLGLIRCKKP